MPTLYFTIPSKNFIICVEINILTLVKTAAFAARMESIDFWQYGPEDLRC